MQFLQKSFCKQRGQTRQHTSGAKDSSYPITGLLRPTQTKLKKKASLSATGAPRRGNLGFDAERQGFEPVRSGLLARARSEAGPYLLNPPDKSAVASGSAELVGLHLRRGRPPGLDNGGGGRQTRSVQRRRSAWRRATA